MNNNYLSYFYKFIKYPYSFITYIFQIIEAEDLVNPNIDELSVLTYVSLLKNATPTIGKREGGGVGGGDYPYYW